MGQVPTLMTAFSSMTSVMTQCHGRFRSQGMGARTAAMNAGGAPFRPEQELIQKASSLT